MPFSVIRVSAWKKKREQTAEIELVDVVFLIVNRLQEERDSLVSDGIV